MSLFGAPAPDFSDPLGLLAACHRRILTLCGLLERLPTWISAHGVDDDAVAAAERVIDYFDRAAPLHHQDEEEDLFPLLMTDRSMAALIAQLDGDHAQLERDWQRLSGELRGLVDARHATVTLQDTIARFCAAHRAHIALEDAELLPAARARLDSAQAARLGGRMAARRGQAHSPQ